MRPGDDDSVPVAVALRWQQEYVEGAGSPTGALILATVADDVEAAGPLSALLPGTVRFGSLPGVRVMAAVHLLALTRRAPDVALFLPTLGGRAPADARQREAFRQAVVACLLAHPDVLVASMARTPQTNETGRAALLRHALTRLEADRPVLLWEIGCSAGLNLRVDHLPALLEDEGAAIPRIVRRTGCDLAPVDPTTPEGRALLTSYVWVDDIVRFERLRRALQLAQEVPATVRQQDAVDAVEELDVTDGHATVLWHSAMWMYLDRAAQRRILDAVRRLGARATADAPLVHACWEWDPTDSKEAGFALVSRTWRGEPDDGRPLLLATGMSHGGGVVLRNPAQVLDREPLVTDR